MTDTTDPWAAYLERSGAGPPLGARGEYTVPLPTTQPRQDTLMLPPGAREQSEFAETVGDTASAAADTASFGAYPRLAALRAMGLDKTKDYTQELDKQLADLRMRSERSPYGTFAGDVMGSVLGPGTVLAAPRIAGMVAGRAVPTMAQQIARPALRRYGTAVAEGAGVGGAEAVGHTYSNDPSDYAANALAGTGVGGVTGLTAPILGAFSGGLYRVPADMSRRAPGTLVRAAETDAPQLRALRDRAFDAINTGEPFREMIPDVGPILNAEAKASVVGRSWPGQAALINNLTERNRTSSRFIDQQGVNILGPRVIPTYQQEAIDELRNAMRPQYEAALNSPNVRRTDTQALHDWLLDQAALNGETTAGYLDRLRNQLYVRGAPGVLDPHPTKLQAVRTDLRAMLEKHDLDSNTRRLLSTMPGSAEEQLTRELQRTVPGIQQLDDRYAELMARRRAYDVDNPLGFGMFVAGKTAMEPDRFARELQRAQQPKGSAGPSQERADLALAARARVDNVLNTTRDDLRAAEKLFGQEHDWNAQKLVEQFGPDRAQRLMNMLAVERAGRDTYQGVVKNSETALRQAQAKQQEITGGAVDPGQSMYSHGLKFLKGLKDSVLSEFNAGTRNRIAELSSANTPRGVIDAANLLLDTGAARNRRQAITSVLTQRAFTGGAGIIPKYRSLPEEDHAP